MLTEEQKIILGNKLVDILYLKRDKQGNIPSDFGSKSTFGLAGLVETLYLSILNEEINTTGQ